MFVPYYQDSAVTIYHGDCRDILPQIDGIDAIVTDPPYGINFNYVANRTRNLKLDWGHGNNGDIQVRPEWRNIIGDHQAFDPAHLLKYPEIILWGANNYASKLPDSRGWLIWDKLMEKKPSCFGDVEIAWTNKDMPTRIHHQLWRGIVRQGAENAANGKKLHPAQKPIALMIWCIGFTTGRIICDPYMGSGTTLRAGKDLNRQVIGIELDEAYCEITANRMQQEVFAF